MKLTTLQKDISTSISKINFLLLYPLKDQDIANTSIYLLNLRPKTTAQEVSDLIDEYILGKKIYDKSKALLPNLIYGLNVLNSQEYDVSESSPNSDINLAKNVFIDMARSGVQYGIEKCIEMKLRYDNGYFIELAKKGSKYGIKKCEYYKLDYAGK